MLLISKRSCLGIDAKVQFMLTSSHEVILIYLCLHFSLYNKIINCTLKFKASSVLVLHLNWIQLKSEKILRSRYKKATFFIFYFKLNWFAQISWINVYTCFFGCRINSWTLFHFVAILTISRLHYNTTL